ncbi:MAG TPA: hypothetical protein VGR46_13445 [Candidatus Limnocylindria bacterium]|nr:hypothetical protein [Candidatus Limnocylindria bacterium]
MKLRALLASLAILVLSTGVAFAVTLFQVTTAEFDPAKTFLVQAQWLDGIGCPTNGKISLDGTTTTPYQDTGCPSGDTSDTHNQGLLLAKTGPTPNVASAVAELNGVQGMTLTELGYDIRKPGSAAADARGSHCGAGAPRFNVVTQDGVTHFVGCNSPLATVTAASTGWLRLRWTSAQLLAAGIATTAQVKSITIVFDEGQDTGPDNFGLAVLDNIDVNGTLVGAGQSRTNGHGKGHGEKHNKNHGNHGDKDDNDQGENDDDD